ncbi:MAG: AAA family ATPase, partial [Actinobacteria bacterium]|nr:AAA family ATPase [Actinomycetota bacterium]
MRCQSCGSDNREGRRFCRECGTALSLACPSCGAGNEPDDRFCGECGSPLSADAPTPDRPSGAPVRPEQRFVSVLFADMAGYTALSETRDSEDIRDLLTDYFDRSRTIIERFGGTVDKFIGDAVMGVWGATEAREDDAQRAVRAALELVDMVAALGDEAGIPDLRLRAGVNSGTTSVGPGGNEKGLVVGDLVNVASRLQSIAEPGAVYVGNATQSVSGAAIDYRFVGERDLKGKADAVGVWQALRVAGMREGRHDDVRHPPFVGRDRELRLLKDALAGVEADRRARLLSIVGEAGIGKTRLAEEFRNHIDGYTQSIFWHWGRSPSYGDGVAFWALGEMVRRRSGIVEGEDQVRSMTRLRTSIAELVPVEDDRKWIEPRLAGLLGLAEMPAGSRADLFSALRSYFQNIAAQGTVVLVFEDAHWADSGLIEFISELVERSSRSPILVVTLARPDLLERHPTWGTQHRSSMAVRLAPLPDADMVEMVHQYVPGIGDEVVGQVVRRSTGFPLYAVEIVRMLTASGDLVADGDRFRYEGDPSAMALPETLQTVIGARLDRLDPVERALLQDGAVLGQAFHAEAIASLRGEPVEEIRETLAPLLQYELLELQDDPRSPERGQYRFVQSLIHEVAYQRLGRDERRAKHLQVAGYYEDLGDPELAGFVAGHFMGAYEATPAGPEKEEMVARAMRALGDAADRALDLHSYRQAVDLLEEAIDLAPDESHCLDHRIKAAYAWSDYNEPDRGIAHLDTARRHCEAAGDVQGLRRVATAASFVHNSHYGSDRALEAVREAYEGLEEIEDAVAVGLAAEAARAFALTMHPQQAVEAADRLLPAASRLGDVATVLHVLVSKATALATLGRRVEAYSLLRGVAEEAEIRGLLDPAGRALNNLASVIGARNAREAARLAERLEGLLARSQNVSWMVRHAADSADFEIDDGRYAKAAEHLDHLAGEDLTEFWEEIVGLQRSRMLHLTTGDADALEAAHRHAAYFDGEADPQIRAGLDHFKSALARNAGDWEASYRYGMLVDPGVLPLGVWDTAHAAAWLGDLDRLARVEELLERCSDGVPRLDRYLAAIRTALEGDPAAASAEFVAAMEEWPVRLLGVDMAQANATFAKVVGPGDPAAAAAAAA